MFKKHGLKMNLDKTEVMWVGKHREELNIRLEGKDVFFFFFSSHYTTPAQCWAQDLARGLNSSRSSWVQGCGRMGQTGRCFMVCSSPHSHVVCPSSLNPHFCIRDLHLPVPVRRRFRLDQVGHVSLEPGGSDSLGLNESLCGVVWRWLDQRVSIRVRALPSRGSTEWRKLCLDLSLFLAGSCSYRGCRGSFSCLSFSSWDETARLICGGAIPHNKYRSSTLVGLRHPEIALQAAFRTGSIFEACDDLLQTGDAYSAEEKHRARAVVRIVLASVPQLVFANFLRMLFLAPVFALVLAMWSLYVRHRSRVTPR